MTDQISDATLRARLFERAVSRWENEGGAVMEADAAEQAFSERSAAAPGVAEFEQMKFRVIALENLVTVLLAQASDRQLGVVADMADHIAANPGTTPYPATIRAVTKMRRLLEAADHLRSLCLAQDTARETPTDANRLSDPGGTTASWSTDSSTGGGSRR
jgi:hypothetical protein